MKYKTGKLDIPCSIKGLNVLNEIQSIDVLYLQINSDNMGQRVVLYSEDFVKRLLASAKETKTILAAIETISTPN